MHMQLQYVSPRAPYAYFVAMQSVHQLLQQYALQQYPLWCIQQQLLTNDKQVKASYDTTDNDYSR